MTGGITLAPLMTEIKVDLNGFKSQMNKAATAGVGAAKDMSNKMSGVAKIGDKIGNIGASLTKKVTLPIVAAGTASVKFALDAEQSFAKVGTVIDKSAVPVDKLKQDITNASNQTGVAITDLNEALYQSISAGVDSGKAIQFTTDMTKLAKGGFTSTTNAVDVVTSALNAYGLSADQATSVSDKLITTQNLGKTTVDALSTSLGKIIPTAKNVNLDMDNVCTGMAQLTKNGIQTAEATTYFNSMLNELGKSGSTADKALREMSGKGFADLIKSGVPLTEVLGMLQTGAKKSGKSLGDMFGSAEAAKAAQTIMKDGGIEYNQILNQMQNSAGATQKAFDEMDATPMEQLKKTMNGLKNAAIAVGERLIPIVVKIADKIKGLAEAFMNLSPAQQETIVKIGLVAAAIGPLLLIVAKAITVCTTLAPVFQGIGVALSVLTGPVGLVVAGIAALVAVGIGVYKVFSEEVVPAVDLFADSTGEAAVKISDETKNAVGSYMEMDDQVTKTMYDMRIKNTTVTDEMAQQMTGTMENMSGQITDAMRATAEKSTQSITELFMSSGEIIDAEEQEILNSLNQHNADKQASVDGWSRQINEIYGRAADEHRALTSDEFNQISQLQGQMRDTAITELSATEEEAAVIRQRMKDYQGRLTAEMASESIQNAVKARDGEISTANDKYNQIIKEAERLRQAGAITDEQYNSMVNKARETRDGQIQKANETYNGITNEIRNATPGIESQVDLQSGRILTRWDKLKAGMSSAWSSTCNWFKTHVGDPLKAIWDKFGDMWNAGKDWIGQLWEGLKNAWESVKTWVSEKANWIKDSLNPKNWFNSWGGGKDGGHYNGLSYVPFDGYNAVLHKGERVLTAEENRMYIQGSGRAKSGDTYNFYSPKAIDEREAARLLRRLKRLEVIA